MKILLIAYEFPPILAAQSLRWFHLANELVAQGIHMEVLCPDIAPNQAFPLKLDPRIMTYRVWPGPFIGLGEYAAKRAAAQPVALRGESAIEVSAKLSLLSRGYGIARDLLNRVVYPDIRSEWYFFARSKLKQLLAANKYDLVLSSHEPAVDVFLGFHAKKKGFPWIVDLGDPLLTPYSPSWRRAVDLRVERHIVRRADHLVVTDDKVIDLLVKRHGDGLRGKLTTISQGFSAVLPRLHEPRNVRFTVCFTGNFYSDFRNPAQLAEALRRMRGVNFGFYVIGNNGRFKELFEGVQGVEFLGQKSHSECLEWQRCSDLLINIGNVQGYQIPGKIYEYLGSGKPVLHIKTSIDDDPGAALIEQARAGVVVQNDAGDIALAFEKIYQIWLKNSGEFFLKRDEDLIGRHTWVNKAESYRRLFYSVGGDRRLSS